MEKPTFEQRHPWIVYEPNGCYTRFTNEQQARVHATEVDGIIEYQIAEHPAVLK